jgi:hypothetical protein
MIHHVRLYCDYCDEKLPERPAALRTDDGIVLCCGERCMGDYRAREVRSPKIQRSLGLGVAAWNGA